MYHDSRTITSSFSKPFTHPDPTPIKVSINEASQERWAKGETIPEDLEILASVPEIIVRGQIALGVMAQKSWEILGRVHELIMAGDLEGAAGTALGAQASMLKAYENPIKLASVASLAVASEQRPSNSIILDGDEPPAAGGPVRLKL